MKWVIAKIENDLHKKLKLKAIREGKAIKQIIIELVMEYLKR